MCQSANIQRQRWQRTTSSRSRSLPCAEQLSAPLFFDLKAADKDCSLPQLFTRNEAMCVLDIGFGNGENLAGMAADHPHLNFIGCELFTPGIHALAKQARQLSLTNVRLINGDARDVLQRGLRPGCLDAILLFFPDPWPKRRHHKRRLVQPEFCALAHRCLKAGGILWASTDDPDYARWIVSQFTRAPGWKSLPEASAADASRWLPKRIPTHFERKAQRAGRAIHELCFHTLPAA